MKARDIATLAALGALTLAGSAFAQALDPKFDPSRLVTPPLGRIEPVKPERPYPACGTSSRRSSANWPGRSGTEPKVSDTST